MWTSQSSMRAENQIPAIHVRVQGWPWRAGCAPTARPAKRHELTEIADRDSDSVSGRAFCQRIDFAVRMFHIKDGLPAPSGARRQRPRCAAPATLDKLSAEGSRRAWDIRFASPAGHHPQAAGHV
jgi:hypothetical protein